MAIAQNDPMAMISNLLTMVGGKSTTQTTQSNISSDGVNALIQQILSGSQGLAAVSSGQRGAGMYNSTVNSQLTNDLLTRIAGETAKQTAGTTTTTRQNPQAPLSSLLTAGASLGVGKLLAPTAKGLAKKTGMDTWGDKIANSLGLGSPSAGGPGSAITGSMASNEAASSIAADIGTGMTAADVGATGTAGLSELGVGSTMEAADATAATAMGEAGIAGDAALATVGTESAAETAAVTAAEGSSLAESLATAAAIWVICTELNAQGRLSDELYKASATRALMLPEDVMAGYHYWAVPLVSYLRKSTALSSLFQYLATSRCEYLLGKSRFWGWLSVVAGEPICGMIGRRLTSKTNWKVLYG
jgi:hypothetical protein